MITEEQIDWERLKNPHPLFKVFKMDEKNPIEFWRKFVELSRMFKNKYLYLSDEYRSDTVVRQLLGSLFNGGHINLNYEIGDFQGIICFREIIPEYKCEMTFKLWDKRAWNREFARAGKELIDLVMDSFGLKRIGTSTPDKRLVKMARIAGFKEEGEQPNSFRWKGKNYSTYFLGKVKED